MSAPNAPMTSGEDLIPLRRQMECVARELTFRRRCYPRWVKEGKMTQAKADTEIACMEAVLRTLEGVLEI